jgi:hypothetical protein
MKTGKQHSPWVWWGSACCAVIFGFLANARVISPFSAETFLSHGKWVSSTEAAPAALKFSILAALVFAGIGTALAFRQYRGKRNARYEKEEEPNQPLQRNASTGSASNFESPARRG